MEFDRTKKMLLAFLAVNLLAVGIGLAATLFFGIMAGLAAFTVSIIMLPLFLQKKFLEKFS